MNQPAVPSGRRAARRRQILQQAASLFASQGYAGVTLADVAREVGVTPPALYRHVATKEALAVAVAAEFLEDISREVLSAGDGLAERAHALMAAAVERPQQLRSYVMLDPAFARALSAELAAPLRRAERRLLDAFATVPADTAVRRARLAGCLAAMDAVSDRESTRGRSPLGRLGRLGRAIATGVAEYLGSEQRSHDPPVVDQRRWSPPRLTRTAVLSSALRLFRERGFEGASVDEIGRAAGLSGPSVYRYFESKADILVEAVDRTTVTVLGAVEQALATAVDPATALDELAERYATVAVRNVDAIVVMAREQDRVPTESQDRHRRRRREVLDAWSSLVRSHHGELSYRDVRALVRAAMAAARMVAVVGTTSDLEERAAVAEARLAIICLVNPPQPAASPRQSRR